MKLGEIIRNRRKKMGLSLAKLRDITGVSATYIMQIEKGHIPTNKVLMQLSEGLKLDNKDLLKTAEYEKDPEAFNIMFENQDNTELIGQVKPMGRYVPVIDYTQAGEWREIIDSYLPGQGMDEVPVSSEREELIAFRVKGSSMEPVIRNGQVVVVDPNREANPGDIVIAVKDGASTIKRYHRLDENTVILEPLNPAFEKIILTKKDAGDLRIVGVVIEIKLIA